MAKKGLLMGVLICWLFALIILFLTSCASTEFHSYNEWKTEDKILFGANVGLNVIDVVQTNECVNIHNCFEANTALARKDGKPDILRVIGFKVLLTSGQYYALGHKEIDSKSKTIALGIGTAALTAVIVSNAFQLKRSGYSGLAMILPILSW